MELVDAICRRCGKPFRWACLTAILCNECRDEAESEKSGAALPLANERLQRQRQLVEA